MRVITGYTGKTTNSAEDAVGQVAQGERDTQWGAIPGVTSGAWNGRTANVQPQYKPVINGQQLEMPELLEVVIDQPMTSNGGMTFPIPVGTPVMLTPQMRALDDFEEGGDAKPYDARSFHVSTMRGSLSGGEALSQTIENVDLENFHMRFNAAGTYGIKGSPDGKFKIEGAEGDVYDLLATAIELIAGDQLQINYGSSAGTGHALENAAALTVIAGKLRAMAL